MQKLCIVFGVLDTKDWTVMVNELAPFGSSWHLLRPKSERALPLGDLREYLTCFGINATTYESELELIAALNLCKESAILITGSIYMVGSLRAALGKCSGELQNNLARPLWTASACG